MAEGRRQFLIEILGKVDQAVDALNRVSQSLAGMQLAADKTNAALKENFGGGEDAAKRMGGASVDMAADFFVATQTIQIASAAFRGSVGRMLDESARLQDTMADVNGVLEFAGASTDRLAERFLAAGKAPEPLLQAAAELARAGVKGSDALERLALVSDQVGKIVGVSAASAAGQLRMLTQTLNEQPENIEKVASAVVNLTQKMGGTVEGIASLTRFLGPAATQIGLTTPQVLGLAATLDTMGLNGRKAGLALTQVLFKLKTDSSKVASALGISSEEMAKALREDPQKAVTMVLDRIKAMGPEALPALKKMGLASGTTGTALLGLAQNVDKVRQAWGLAAEGDRKSVV